MDSWVNVLNESSGWFQTVIALRFEEVSCRIHILYHETLNCWSSFGVTNLGQHSFVLTGLEHSNCDSGYYFDQKVFAIVFRSRYNRLPFSLEITEGCCFIWLEMNAINLIWRKVLNRRIVAKERRRPWQAVLVEHQLKRKVIYGWNIPNNRSS